MSIEGVSTFRRSGGNLCRLSRENTETSLVLCSYSISIGEPGTSIANFQIIGRAFSPSMVCRFIRRAVWTGTRTIAHDLSSATALWRVPVCMPVLHEFSRDDDHTRDHGNILVERIVDVGRGLTYTVVVEIEESDEGRIRTWVRRGRAPSKGGGEC